MFSLFFIKILYYFKKIMRKRCLYYSFEELFFFGEEGYDDVIWDWDYSVFYNSRIVGQ